jgi:hypothetical protein
MARQWPLSICKGKAFWLDMTIPVSDIGER